MSDSYRVSPPGLHFPPEIDRKVDMSKVEMKIIEPWITQRITELLGIEDEVVVGFVTSLLEEKDMEPRLMETQITGFFEGNTHAFVTELWELLTSAEQNGGIPPKLIEQEKQALLKKMEENQKIQEQIRAKRAQGVLASSSSDSTARRSRWDEGNQPSGENLILPTTGGSSEDKSTGEASQSISSSRKSDRDDDRESSRRRDSDSRSHRHRRYDESPSRRNPDRDYRRSSHRDYDRDRYRDRDYDRDRDRDRYSRDRRDRDRDYDHDRRDRDRDRRDRDRDSNRKDSKRRDTDRDSKRKTERDEFSRESEDRKRQPQPSKDNPDSKRSKLELSEEEERLRQKCLESKLRANEKKARESQSSGEQSDDNEQ